MRTGPVALGSLDSAEQTSINARAISQLTHWDDDAGDACVLWSVAIRHAIVNGDLNIRVGLEHLPEERRERWVTLIDEAEVNNPAFFRNNGWVVHAFQAAWSSISIAKSADSQLFAHDAERLQYGLEQAVRAGFDTDTVAAIAGSLLGAFYGSTAVPASWRLKMHGWPSIDELTLSRMTHEALTGSAEKGVWPNVSTFDYSEWSGRNELTQHPADSGLWIGGVGSLERLPAEVTAVVSLCRVGTEDVPRHIDRRLEVYLMDKPGIKNNLNAGFVFQDVADAIAELRKEGEIVYLHCVQSQSRTPSVAASYAMRHFGRTATEALEEIAEVLPLGRPIEYFVQILKDQDK
jgi:hypothetical protein